MNGIAVVDRYGKILYSNELADNIFIAHGLYQSEVFPTQILGINAKQQWQQILDGEPWQSEVYVGGNEYILSLHAIKKSSEVEIVFNAICISEQNKSDEPLYRKIYEETNDAVFIVDAAEIKILDCNQAALDILELESKNELKEKWGNSIKLTNYDEKQLQQFYYTLNTLGHYKDTFEIQSALGNKIWVEFKVSLINDKGREIYLTRLTDLTEQKIYENRLKETEILFNLVTKATQDGIYNFDIKTNTIWVSNEYIKIMGYSAEETQNHSQEWFKQKLHPEDLHKAEEMIRDVYESSKNHHNIEIRVRHASGKYIILVDRNFIVRDEQGRPVSIIGSITEVTELRNKEQALRDSEKQLKDILNTVDEAVFSYTIRKGEWPKFLFFSDTSLKLTGYENHEILNENMWFSRVHPDDQETITEFGYQELLNLRPITIEYRFLHKNGNIIWIYSKQFPQLLEDGSIKVTGTAIDLTLYKQTEEQLKEQNENLIKINNELDRFVYSASHDLRAPLTSVLGLVNIFKSEVEKEEQLSYLNMIETSIKRLDKFVTNIVDYSRNNRVNLNLQPVNIKEIVQECLENHQYLEKFEHIQIIQDLLIEAPFYSDKLRLQMIFNNIISNAIKFQNSDLPNNYIIIQAHITKDGLKIKIEDNGPGIPEKYIDKVFDMFFTTSINNRGSGIGLYIVKEAVAKLGGTIQATSELNKGSTFEIILPHLPKE